MTQLFINRISFDNTSFPQTGPWSPERLQTAAGGPLVCFRISAAPPGKHDVSECPTHEAAWQAVFGQVIRAITDERVCLLWASGPMEQGDLPQVIAHMFPWDGDFRYHVEEVTFLEKNGYVYSWVSFEFNTEAFQTLLKECRFGDATWLYGLVTDEEKVSALLPCSFQNFGHDVVGESAGISFCITSHNEGIYILGRDDLVNAAITRIKASPDVRFIDTGD